jgi:uncharacterized protein (DUF302 family)
VISARSGTIVAVERVINKAGHATVAETAARLIAEVEARGTKLFTTIDHSAQARATGLELPLKVLVRADPGRTCVSSAAPAELAARYQLSDELAAGLAGIDALTEAAVGR